MVYHGKLLILGIVTGVITRMKSSGRLLSVRIMSMEERRNTHE